MILRTIRGLLLVVLVCIACSSDIWAVQVEYFENLTGARAASDDTLQDVFPLMYTGDKLENDGYPTSALVDGGGYPSVWLLGPGRPDNSMDIGYYGGPVRMVWDLQKSGELSKLSVWMYAGRGGSLGAQWSVSSDGKTYTAIPGAECRKVFPVNPVYESMTLMHRVDFLFAEGEVKDFRYLQLTLSAVPNQEMFCEMLEVDGWIKGVSPAKSTQINTSLAVIKKTQISSSLPKDQSKTPPMQVQAVRFKGNRLVLSKTGLAVMDLKSIISPDETGWKLVSNKAAANKIVVIRKRDDGLLRTNRLILDKSNRLKLNVEIQLPANAESPVNYQTTLLRFNEADVAFDGVVWGSGSGPVFIDKNKPTKCEFPDRPPYVIYPSQKEKLEVQFYMPDWLDLTGSLYAYPEKSQMLKLELLAAVQNFGVKDLTKEKNFDGGGKWIGQDKVIKPGEKIAYQMNIGVFAIPKQKPLGQIDIEAKRFNANTGIEAGTGDQQVNGDPRVLQRDKMQFMGFKLAPPRAKLGHCLQINPEQNVMALLDQFKRSGVGALTLFGDYRDVGHGVIYNCDYNQSPIGFSDLLKAIKANGIVSLVWFTPTGFMQVDSGATKKDAMVEKHPDWFVSTAHWFGAHRTVNIINPEPLQWSLDKIKQDLTRFPDLGGIYFDMFPWMSAPQSRQMIKETGKTAARNQMDWVKKYAKTIKSFGKDKIILGWTYYPGINGSMYGDLTGSEHPLDMYLNEVSPGQVPFGHPFVRWTQYGHLYFWYSVLGQMYYNFCDYDQAVGYVGTTWVGMDEGQMHKSYVKEVAPYWYLCGKGTRIFGAQIAPQIRQVEARLPNKQLVVLVCSMSCQTTSVQIVPRNVPVGRYQVKAFIDTAQQHLEKELILNVGKEGIAMNDLPPYSIVRYEFMRR